MLRQDTGLCSSGGTQLAVPERGQVIKACPVVLCPACRKPGVHGNYNERTDHWSISCNKCGTEMEIPSIGSDLESACELLNRCEHLGYEVNKSVKGAREL